MGRVHFARQAAASGQRWGLAVPAKSLTAGLLSLKRIKPPAKRALWLLEGSSFSLSSCHARLILSTAGAIDALNEMAQWGAAMPVPPALYAAPLSPLIPTRHGEEEPYFSIWRHRSTDIDRSHYTLGQ